MSVNEYICTHCGNPTQRDLLTVKKIVFLEMGLGGRTVRSRVNGWLCPSCVAGDSEWNREPFVRPAPLKKNRQVITNG